MENRYVHLFRVAFMLHSFVLFFLFTEVISAPVAAPTITAVMRNDANLCETSKFLYDSEYTKLCSSVAYPTTPWDSTSGTLNSSLCLGVYDTAYKICQYLNSSRLKIPLNIAVFHSYIEKFVSDKNPVQDRQFCDHLQGLTPLYNKTDFLWRPLTTSLDNPDKCLRICFDYRAKIHPLCAVLAWIKTIDDDIKKKDRIGTKYDSTSDKLPPSQPNDEMASDSKKTILTQTVSEIKETKKQSTKQIITNSKDNPVKEINSNVPGNVPNAEDIEKSITEKPGETLKKINNTSSETQANKSILPVSEKNKENIDTKPGTDTEIIKNIPANNGPQDPSVNNAADNVPNKSVVHEGNVEESNKKQVNDDLKTSTISENTQDHYDAGNTDEDMETNMGDNIDDIDNTIQQPLDQGNRNENVQEVIEQKNNLRYSNIRTEDDSHFFTYFTIITLACIAGYIGYHNKQKILAIVLEGRRSRSNRGRRRPSTASYRKLDCTLEEAVTSQ